MLIGAMYGGMALTSAGTAAVHAMAYPLGGNTKFRTVWPIQCCFRM
ncbi:iron-containing alcohol dehydrogenase [Bacillus licheniformis]